MRRRSFLGGLIATCSIPFIGASESEPESIPIKKRAQSQREDLLDTVTTVSPLETPFHDFSGFRGSMQATALDWY